MHAVRKYYVGKVRLGKARPDKTRGAHSWPQPRIFSILLYFGHSSGFIQLFGSLARLFHLRECQCFVFWPFLCLFGKSSAFLPNTLYILFKARGLLPKH